MTLDDILKKLKGSEITVEEARSKINLLAIQEIEDKLKLDISREQRTSVPEIVLAEHKDIKTLEKSIEKLIEEEGRAIVSRLKENHLHLVKSLKESFNVRLSSNKKLAVIKTDSFVESEINAGVGILTGGTADIPLAEEVEILLQELGCEVEKIFDAGVAGLQRTIEAVKKMHEKNVDVIVVLAGMEGALPSIVKSLTELPVIGLPTSKGYGLGGEGKAAILSMLLPCTPGLVTVNIDNTVGAAVAAFNITRRIARYK